MAARWSPEFLEALYRAAETVSVADLATLTGRRADSISRRIKSMREHLTWSTYHLDEVVIIENADAD